jgi:hypothetical protein
MTRWSRKARYCINLLLILLSALSVDAATYYVRPDGNNESAGTANDPENAWLTIQRATFTMVPGDVCRVQPGTYEEHVFVTSGGSPGNLITYIADGPVIVREFDISGDYLRIVGFEISHPTDVGRPGIAVSGDFVELWHNNIHNTSTDTPCILPNAAHSLHAIGNTFSFPGINNSSNGIGFAMSIFGDTGLQDNVLWEYNRSSQCDDHFNPSGTNYLLRNNVMGPNYHSNFLNDPHIDGWHAHSETVYGWMEANWHVDNQVSNAHIALIEAPTRGRNRKFSVLKSVSIRNGDQLWYQMRDGTNLYSFHNTVGEVGISLGGPANRGFYFVFAGANGPSIDNEAGNNIYTNVTTREGTVYEIEAGSALRHSHDLVYPPAADLTDGVNGDIEEDPRFADYAANNFLLRPTSRAIDSGGTMARVDSPDGMGHSFVVGNVDPFYNPVAFGLPVGQTIYVGDDNNLVITNVDYGTRTISVSTPFAWAEGDAVGYAYRGNGPDLGAYEYGDTLLSAATIEWDGSKYTVRPDGDTRFVVFYRDGLPHSIDFAEPFTATIEDGVVTANAFALHAQATPFVPAVPLRQLSIHKADPSRIEITWPIAASGYIVEFTDTFPAATWTRVTNVPTIQFHDFKLALEATPQQRWFRLAKLTNDLPSPPPARALSTDAKN